MAAPLEVRLSLRHDRYHDDHPAWDADQQEFVDRLVEEGLLEQRRVELPGTKGSTAELVVAVGQGIGAAAPVVTGLVVAFRAWLQRDKDRWIALTDPVSGAETIVRAHNISEEHVMAVFHEATPRREAADPTSA